MDSQIIRHYEGLFESGRWFKFSIMEQLSNVGTDLDRCMRWKKEGRLEESRVAFERALELLGYTILDPKNRGRCREIARAKELMVDYFVYDNEHKTSDEFWHNYFMFFSYIAAEECAQKYEKLRQSRNKPL